MGWTSVRFPSPFSSKVPTIDTVFVALPLSINETLKQLSPLPMFNAGVILVVTV